VSSSSGQRPKRSRIAAEDTKRGVVPLPVQRRIDHRAFFIDPAGGEPHDRLHQVKVGVAVQAGGLEAGGGGNGHRQCGGKGAETLFHQA